jgi:hypothetical protein
VNGGSLLLEAWVSPRVGEKGEVEKGRKEEDERSER